MRIFTLERRLKTVLVGVTDICEDKMKYYWKSSLRADNWNESSLQHFKLMCEIRPTPLNDTTTWLSPCCRSCWLYFHIRGLRTQTITASLVLSKSGFKFQIFFRLVCTKQQAYLRTSSRSRYAGSSTFVRSSWGSTLYQEHHHQHFFLLQRYAYAAQTYKLAKHLCTLCLGSVSASAVFHSYARSARHHVTPISYKSCTTTTITETTEDQEQPFCFWFTRKKNFFILKKK